MMVMWNSKTVPIRFVNITKIIIVCIKMNDFKYCDKNIHCSISKIIFLNVATE